MVKKKNIGTLLREYGLINDQELEEGLNLQNQAGLRLGEALVRLGKVTSEDIDWILSKQLDIPFVIVDDLSIDRDLAGRFPRDFLINNRILPMYENDEEIAVVTDDPFNHEAFEALRRLAQKRLKLSSGSGRNIEEILKKSLRKGGIPALISHVEAVIRKIEGTAFYRIDFFLSEQRSDISVFGSGILKTLFSLNETFGKEDIFRTLDAIGVAFLYEEHSNENTTFMAIFPLTVSEAPVRTPAIIGSYGLWLPGVTGFTDSGVYGVPNLLNSPSPVPGYPYIAIKRGSPGSAQNIYTLDSAPQDFENYYVKVHVPEKCEECSGEGCKQCNGLGHQFRVVEGIYSSDDLRDALRKD